MVTLLFIVLLFFALFAAISFMLYAVNDNRSLLTGDNLMATALLSVVLSLVFGVFAHFAIGWDQAIKVMAINDMIEYRADKGTGDSVPFSKATGLPVYCDATAKKRATE